MDLIIGGAYAGKLTYAVKEYGLSQGSLFDLAHGLPAPRSAPCCLYHLEAFTRACAVSSMRAEEVAAALAPFTDERHAVIVSREIGCGIVPMDALERAYRELHGQVLALLAAKAARVVRIFAGIEEVLK
ncbi:MAG: bifunctional adenosylcobinamide kinase/adenosylcobinamide-phosphate guanylyltransferase [Clostridia bacterium]|nr:bifunctional adenosylcobinamide kinase/adenosylcobinamide-phosphate guanylyltransferase [Clostridia bacterium]